MKKSIFKRIVSDALALTTLASTAIVMSTSVSSATDDRPGKVYFNVYVYENPKIYDEWSFIDLDWKKIPNAAKYKVKLIYKKENSDYYDFKEYETSKTYIEDLVLPLRYSKNFNKGTFNLSVSAIDAFGREGESTSINDLKFDMSQGHVPCMAIGSLVNEDCSATEKPIKLSSTSVKVKLLDEGLPIKRAGVTAQHITQGYEIKLTAWSTLKSKWYYTDYSDSLTKECIIKNLKSGETYSMSIRPFVRTFDGSKVFGKDLKIFGGYKKDYTYFTM